MSGAAAKSESVILCEGYHDRAFWAGWLEKIGCRDLGQRAHTNQRIQVQDPWGVPVVRGQYAYHSRSGRFLRIVPCQGKPNVLPEAKSRLRDRAIRPLDRLVLNFDADVTAGEPVPPGSAPADSAVRQLLEQFGSFHQNEQHEFVLVGPPRETVVSVVRWEAPDPCGGGLPHQQTLERLVCAALGGAYPPRAPAVQQWLDSRPDAPPQGPKEFAWSYMAGWYADHGCEAFFRCLWTDGQVASELERRLRHCAAWRVAEALAE